MNVESNNCLQKNKARLQIARTFPNVIT